MEHPESATLTEDDIKTQPVAETPEDPVIDDNGDTTDSTDTDDDTGSEGDDTAPIEDTTDQGDDAA